MKPKNKEKPKQQKKSAPKTDETEQIRRQLKGLQNEKDDVFGQLQRVSADYANYQKRAPKQISDTIAYEKEMIIKTFLPILDNLEHTLQNADQAENADVLVEGIRIVYDQMLDVLKSHSIEPVEAVGKKFDPAMHQAMMRKTQPDQKEDIVLEEFQKGYTLNGRVIRPSKVIVNKLEPEKDPQQETDERETTDTE